jgi:hypothetical protein
MQFHLLVTKPIEIQSVDIPIKRATALMNLEHVELEIVIKFITANILYENESKNSTRNSRKPL